MNNTRPKLADRLLPALRRELFERALDGGTPPLSRRIFVNRNLRLDKIRFLGFDLDWTLADYDRTKLDPLTFELALTFLVDHVGYPPAVRQVEFRPAFPRRGLIVDRQVGTVLKMNRHRYVGRAYLGRTRLAADDRFQLYRLEPIDLSSDRYYRVDTLFELPEVEPVHRARRARRARPARSSAAGRRRSSTTSATPSTRSTPTAGSSPRVTADLARFLRRDEELPAALARLALGGRRLFLVTNSDWAYTEALCSHLFDRSLPGSAAGASFSTWWSPRRASPASSAPNARSCRSPRTAARGTR